MLKKQKQLRQELTLEHLMEKYRLEVKEYLNANQRAFMEQFSYLCEKYRGRILYEDLVVLLGKDFPKPQWIPEIQKNRQIVAFFDAIGFPFRADETHLYFP